MSKRRDLFPSPRPSGVVEGGMGGGGEERERGVEGEVSIPLSAWRFRFVYDLYDLYEDDASSRAKKKEGN